jgi:hypothetical protein
MDEREPARRRCRQPSTGRKVDSKDQAFGLIPYC